jgi:hypothetical protein
MGLTFAIIGDIFSRLNAEDIKASFRARGELHLYLVQRSEAGLRSDFLGAPRLCQPACWVDCLGCAVPLLSVLASSKRKAPHRLGRVATLILCVVLCCWL